MEQRDHVEDGYVLLARRIQYSETFNHCRNNNERWMFIKCLLRACHKDITVNGIELKRGQFITGIESFAKETNTTFKQVRNFWKKFENIGFLAREKASKYSIITVLNYDRFQSPENYKGQAKGQAEGKQRATYNKDNNEKNDNNNKEFEKIFDVKPEEVIKTID